MLVTLIKQGGGKVTINTDLVRHLQPYGSSASTMIQFASDDFVLVEGDHDFVVDKIKRATRPPQD